MKRKQCSQRNIEKKTEALIQNPRDRQQMCEIVQPYYHLERYKLQL